MASYIHEIIDHHFLKSEDEIMSRHLSSGKEKKIFLFILLVAALLALFWLYVYPEISKTTSKRVDKTKPELKPEVIVNKIVSAPEPEKPSAGVQMQIQKAISDILDPKDKDAVLANEDKIAEATGHEKPSTPVPAVAKTAPEDNAPSSTQLKKTEATPTPLENKVQIEPTPLEKMNVIDKKVGIAKPSTPKPAAVEAAAEPGTQFRTRKAGHPYTIQISANRKKDSTQTDFHRLAEKGLSPYLIQLDLGEQGVWWNLCTGHYKSWTDAKTAKKNHGFQSAVIKKYPYANLIGEFASTKDLAVTYRFLEKSGFLPYIVQRANNSFLLCVGDFTFDEGAARRSQEKLKKIDIESRVGKR
jgi:hypothetical protein